MNEKTIFKWNEKKKIKDMLKSVFKKVNRQKVKYTIHFPNKQKFEEGLEILLAKSASNTVWRKLKNGLDRNFLINENFLNFKTKTDSSPTNIFPRK